MERRWNGWGNTSLMQNEMSAGIKPPQVFKVCTPYFIGVTDSLFFLSFLCCFSGCKVLKNATGTFFFLSVCVWVEDDIVSKQEEWVAETKTEPTCKNGLRNISLFNLITSTNLHTWALNQAWHGSSDSEYKFHFQRIHSTMTLSHIFQLLLSFSLVGVHSLGLSRSKPLKYNRHHPLRFLII